MLRSMKPVRLGGDSRRSRLCGSPTERFSQRGATLSPVADGFVHSGSDIASTRARCSAIGLKPPSG